MASKIVPNLFFAGEILNVDGITGGFNFQHAWTSGFLASKEISRTLKEG
jgi:predicted flavoprotein YhiN